MIFHLKKVRDKKRWIQDELYGERSPKAEEHTVESSIFKPSKAKRMQGVEKMERQLLESGLKYS